MKKLLGLFCMILMLSLSSTAFAVDYHFGAAPDGVDFGNQLGASGQLLSYDEVMALTGSYDFTLIGGANSTITKFHYGNDYATNERFIQSGWDGYKSPLGNLVLSELSFENAEKEIGFLDADSYVYKPGKADNTNTIKAWLLLEDFAFADITIQAGWTIFGYEFGKDSDWNDMLVAVNTAATPVPAAVWLLGSGVAGLIGLRRKMA